MARLTMSYSTRAATAHEVRLGNLGPGVTEVSSDAEAIMLDIAEPLAAGARIGTLSVHPPGWKGEYSISAGPLVLNGAEVLVGADGLPAGDGEQVVMATP